MATVRESQNSPYWQADVSIWIPSTAHRKGGYWKETTRSTKVLVEPGKESREKALKVAKEIESVGREARKTKLPTKAFFESRVAAMMRAAGVEPPVKDQNWKECADAYLSESRAKVKSKNKYRGELDQFGRYLGARAKESIRIITPEDITRFLNKLQEEGRTLKTSQNTVKTVKPALARAVLHGYLEKSPADFLKLKKTGSDSSKEPFTREEIPLIFYAAASTPGREEWPTICGFGLFNAMRVGDASSRQYEEIMQIRDIWVIHFTPEKKQDDEGLGKPISLPIAPEMMYLVEAKKNGATGFITPKEAALTHRGRGFELILKNSGIVPKIKKRKGKAGRSSSNKTFHSFRHALNTLLLEAEVDVRMRQLISDHESPAMNARYSHGNIVKMAEAVAKATAGIKLQKPA